MKRTPLICALILVSTLAMADEIALVRATPDIAYTNPVWSPDGKSMVYVSYPTGPELATRDTRIARLAGGQWKHKVLAKNADYPIWSPDGKKLAFYLGGLAVMDLASGKTGAKSAGKHYPFSWSPNGRYILYSNDRSQTTMTMDTKAGKHLSFPVGVESVWMADGKLLTSVAGDLLVLDLATGKSRIVAKGIGARCPFIPKGASYAWVRISENPPHGKGIYRVDLKTGKLEKQVSMHAKSLYWSPDGKQFAFLADWALDARTPIQTCLYLGSTRNWEFKIAAKGAGNAASWSPDSKSIAYVTAEGDINILKL